MDQVVPESPGRIVTLQRQRREMQAPGAKFKSLVCKGRGGENASSFPFVLFFYIPQGDFPGGPVVKNLPANAGDKGLMSGLGRFHMLRSN